MVDAFPIGTLLGPNITTGRGSRAANYRAADWDRIVRHGILSDGRPAAMPSEEFQLMSDQELSDIVTYIRSVPPVDNEVPRISLGPLGKVLVARQSYQKVLDVSPGVREALEAIQLINNKKPRPKTTVIRKKKRSR